MSARLHSGVKNSYATALYQGTTLVVPNRPFRMRALAPAHAMQRLKPRRFEACVGTTEVVP